MKAITEKQPWGYLICTGIKDIENRTWKTNFRGKILIHTSAGKEVPFNGQYNHLLNTEQYNLVREKMGLNYFNMPLKTSAIIGSVEIVDCVQNHPSVWAEKGVWNWVLKNPILFNKPIENVKGKLSFWESEHEVCHICGQPADVICAVCGEYFCSDCSAHYNQFTQIDYDCCQRCEESMKERY